MSVVMEWLNTIREWLNTWLGLVLVILALVGLVVAVLTLFRPSPVPDVLREEGMLTRDSIASMEETTTNLLDGLRDRPGEMTPTFPQQPPLPPGIAELRDQAEANLARTAQLIADGDFEQAEARLIALVNQVGTAHESYLAEAGESEEAGVSAVVTELLRAAYLQQGTIAFEREDYKTAVEMYERAYGYAQAGGDAPKVAQALYQIGVAYGFAENHEKAEGFFRRAATVEPTAEAYSNLGSSLAKQGKTDEAIAAFHQALRISPGLAEAHYNLGVALHQQGNTDEAIAAYREALRLNPDYAAARCNLGVALHQQGKTQEAIAEYREALRINPDDVQAHNNLGVALYEQGKTKEAIAEYRQALDINPDLASPHWNLAIPLYSQQRFAEAKAEAEAALRLDPTKEQATRMLELLTEKGY